MSAAPASILFTAPKTYRFQKPPLERVVPDHMVLLVRREDGTWGFPQVGEFDPQTMMVPWVGNVWLATRVAGEFKPPGVDDCDFFWGCREAFVDAVPSAFGPDVLPALRRFDGPLLDQIMARVEAHADTTKPKSGDIAVATESRSDFINAQSRVSRLFQAFGDSVGADPFVQGESLLEYRARLIAPFQKYSPKCKEVNLNRVSDPNAFAAIEEVIFNDAMGEATHPTVASLTPGKLRAIATRDGAGREITRYYGDDGACWSQFNPPIRYVRRFMTRGSAA